jgi:hypothetical protein
MILVVQILGAATGILLMIVMDSPSVVRYMYRKLRSYYEEMAERRLIYKWYLRCYKMNFVFFYLAINLLSLALVISSIKGPP